jgi:preprotein translocase subunit SecE
MGDVKMADNVKRKRNIGKYFKEVILELKKVTWPSRAQLIKHTMTVLAACAVIGILIWVADLIFNFISTQFYSM